MNADRLVTAEVPAEVPSLWASYHEFGVKALRRVLCRTPAKVHRGPRVIRFWCICGQQFPLSYVDLSSDAQLLKVSGVRKRPVAPFATCFGEHTQVL
jgi:hypothetical protein